MRSEALDFIRGILPFYRSAPRTTALLILLTALTAGLFAALPLLLRNVADSALGPGDGIGGMLRIPQLAALVAAALAWVTVSSVAKFAHGNFNDRISATVRSRVYGGWLSHDGEGASGVLGRLTGDIAAFHAGLELATSTLPISTAQGLLALLFMIGVDPAMFGYALCGLAVIGGGFLLVERRLARLSRQSQEAYAGMVGLAAEVLPEFRFVQRFGQEASEMGRFDRAQSVLLTRLKSLRRLNLAARAVIFASLAVGAMALFAVGLGRVQSGTLSSGSLIAFFTLLLVAGSSFVATMDAWSGVAQASAPLRRIEEMQASSVGAPPPPGPGSPDPVPAAPVPAAIEISNAGFRYESAESGFRLADLNLSLEPGATAGFVGRSGSGKSTIARLIAGELRPSSGEILVGGGPAWEVRRRGGQRQLAYIAASPILFTRTLAENVGFGEGRAEEARIRRALEMARLAEDHFCFPEGLSTLLHARGERLSSGQRQRIALAQSILLEPQIIILDEAASSVDSETEARILSGIMEAFPRSTKIIVSHRLSSVLACSRIFVFDDGSLQEQGTHGELVKRGGLYVELFRDQMA